MKKWRHYSIENERKEKDGDDKKKKVKDLSKKL